MSTMTKQATISQQNHENIGAKDNLGDVNFPENAAPGYVKEILTEQDVYTSGVVYRYINNVDPNKDLITDTAKYGGPLHIEVVKDKKKKKKIKIKYQNLN